MYLFFVKELAMVGHRVVKVNITLNNSIEGFILAMGKANITEKFFIHGHIFKRGTSGLAPMTNWAPIREKKYRSA